MNAAERRAAIVRLGEHLRETDEYLDAIIHRTEFNNPWFTRANQEKAIGAIAHHFLTPDKLDAWLQAYELPDAPPDPPAVGLVMAGNIPLVGFHDVLCVFLAGLRSQIKLSEKDQYLLPYLLKLLQRFDPRIAGYFSIVERLSGFDAVIATGSNNTARYFEAYFGKYPHIIRKNRNGVAVLTGEETKAELRALGEDIFRYFGLGCRNVAKLYVPRDYHFDPLLEVLHEFREIVQHNKYKNNFDYNMAVNVLNKTPYRSNGCIFLVKNPSFQSPISGLHYEYYDELSQLETELSARTEAIQCVVARPGLLTFPAYPFGGTQSPEPWDYADGVDTLAFLIELEAKRKL